MRRFAAKQVLLSDGPTTDDGPAKFQLNRVSMSQVISENVSGRHSAKMTVFGPLQPHCGTTGAS